MVKSRFACLPLVFLLLAPPLSAQGPSGPLWESYARGMEILRAALDAHGGAEAIRGVTTFSFRWEGEDFAPTQGVVPDWDAAAANARRVVQAGAIDYGRNRFRFDREFHFGGGYVNALRAAGDGAEMIVYNPLPEHGMGGTTYQRDTTGTAARRNMHGAAALMPALLLRAAIPRAASIRYLGGTAHEGRAEHVIGYTTADGDPVTLHVDAESHLVTARADIGAGSLGDEVDVFRFGEYRTVDGLPVPHVMEVTWNGILAGRHRLTQASRRAELDEELLRVPEGYVSPPPADPPAVVKLSEHVAYIERLGGSYRMLVVDTDEGLVIVDAPLSPAVSQIAIGLIDRAFPGRPLRYLVITHHHGDHIGGIPAFAARGVTILAADGTESYLRRMATVRRTFSQVGAALAAAEKPVPDLRIEPVRGRRTIGAGDRAVEVLDMGATSHAAGMLAVHVPSQKLLFQGDLLRVNEHGGPVPAVEAARDLREAVARLGLDVEAIGAVHGLNATPADLREAERRGAGRR